MITEKEKQEIEKLATLREQGFRNGRADRYLGMRSSFAWFCVLSRNPFEKAYGEGYREGQKK